MWTIKRLSIMDDMPILIKDGKAIMMIDEDHFDDFVELLAKANSYDKLMQKLESETPINKESIKM